MANAKAFVRSVLRETSLSTLHFMFSMTIFEKIVVKTVEFYQLHPAGDVLWVFR